MLYDTQASRNLSLPRASFPLLSLAQYQGKENYSLSLGFPGAWPREVEPEVSTLKLSFPKRFCDTTTIPLEPGLELYVDRSSDGTALHEFFWVRLPPDLVAKRLDVAIASMHGSRSLPLSRLSEMESAMLAVNAGFFDRGGTPVSLVVADGKLVALPAKPGRPALVVTVDGRVLIARPQLSVWLEVDGKRVRVDGFNQAPAYGRIVAYSCIFPKSKLPSGAIYYRLSPEGIMPLLLEDILREDFEDLYLAVNLSPEADPFRNAGIVSVKWRLVDASNIELPVRFAVCGAPMLVENGLVNVTAKLDDVPADIAESVRARTAVGLDKEGALLLVVVREKDDSLVPGFSLEQLAQKLIELGAVTALNLDGGGSSEMTLFGVPLNLSYESERKLPVGLVFRTK